MFNANKSGVCFVDGQQQEKLLYIEQYFVMSY